MPVYNYNIEPVLEAGLVTLLQSAGITAGSSLTTEDLATPRVDVRFELGAELEVGTPSNPGVNLLWQGRFVLTVITDRDRNNVSHPEFRAGVRQAIAETDGAAWTSALGASHRLISLTHQATAYAPRDAEKTIDESAMSYAAVVQLLP